MANKKHLKILSQGVDSWNKWRISNIDICPDLSRAKLSGLDFSGSDFSGVNFNRANLNGANLTLTTLFDVNFGEADLNGANLSQTNLSYAHFNRTNLSKANLSGANLEGQNLNRANLGEANLQGAKLSRTDLSCAYLNSANLTEANLLGANLSGARLKDANISKANLTGVDLNNANLRGANLNGTNLENARLVKADFSKTILTDCRVYGVSAWGIKLSGVIEQKNLRVTPEYESIITVDNLEVAQFVYLLLHNKKIRDTIDTIGRKGILILGRFTKERKDVLDAVRTKLRELNYVPMMFDFEKPTQRDFTETIKTLAGMCRFIIADITNPKSSPLELQATVPDYMIPLVPIIHEDEEPFSMFVDLQNKYDWVLDVLKYDSVESLIKVMDKAVIKPAIEKAEELEIKKARAISEKHVKDFI